MEDQYVKVADSLSTLCDKKIDFRRVSGTYPELLDGVLASGRQLETDVRRFTAEPHAGLLNLQRESATYAMRPPHSKNKLVAKDRKTVTGARSLQRKSATYALRPRHPKMMFVAKDLKTAFGAFNVRVKRLHAEITERLDSLNGQSEQVNALRLWQMERGVREVDASDNLEGAMDKVLASLTDRAVDQHMSRSQTLLDDSTIPKRHCVSRVARSKEEEHMGFKSKTNLVRHFMKHEHEEGAGRWSSPADYATQANLFLRKYSVPSPGLHFCDACLKAIKDDPAKTLLIRREGRTGSVLFDRKAGLKPCRECVDSVRRALHKAAYGEGDIAWEYTGTDEKKMMMAMVTKRRKKKNISGIVRTIDAERLRVVYATMDSKRAFLLSFFKPD